ncbi:uncharacterized protein LOC113034299 isoform X1 [Astatotilapia calliptera]|uniref:uncharacterized protein LOC113023069 isoform X1 n=1 Tax=Astatotilapia calliptera TaxID=8154 RepID=UPI000E401EFA|nr:uncharacterized protein LOC113023069 isoform X1 [Astatotilapia calliptera]XP_026044521.1 uncharacterized protein LOC113034299 isoform X1 [Astatotilapia calliptera]
MRYSWYSVKKLRHAMEKLDEITIANLKEANVGEDLLSSLSRDDIKDLFPGPEHCLRRRALWLAVHKCEENKTAAEKTLTTTGDGDFFREEPSTYLHPKTLDGVEHAAAVFRALPMLFPSSTVPPKKLGICSEAFFHVLKTSEDPEGYLRQRPLACPVLLVSEGNCMIAVGTTPVSTFDRKDLNEELLYLMAYYYALHLTYP